MGNADGITTEIYEVPKYRYAEDFKSVLSISGLLSRDETKPLANRAEEAQRRLFYEQHIYERRKDIENGLEERNEITRQFLDTQKDISINLGEYGEVGARYVVLEPLDELKRAEAKALPPIFLIPGISNDLEGVGWMANEVAYSGRTVVVMGFPESFHGKVTEEFCQGILKDGIKPDVDYFEAVIEKIISDSDFKEKYGDIDKLELWGFSTGGTMALEVAKRIKIQEMLTNLVAVCPPGLVEQPSMKLGIANEFLGSVKNIPDYSKMNPGFQGEVEMTPEYRDLMQRTYEALRETVSHEIPGLTENLKVRDGGHMIMITMNSDKMSRAQEADIGTNNKIWVIDMEGYHASPLIEPEKVIDVVFAAEGGRPRR